MLIIPRHCALTVRLPCGRRQLPAAAPETEPERYPRPEWAFPDCHLRCMAVGARPCQNLPVSFR